MKLANLKHRKAAIGDSYLALIRLHPLRAIKSQVEYDAASAVLDKLALREDLDVGEEEYLEALEVLITAYDDRYAAERADDRSPLERLKSLMEL
jgi:antitoxin component HigA of HigAB toxin-antitoxin module